MAAQVEEILANLLVPDNAVIQQATQQLKVLSKDPAIIPALCTILGSSQNPQVRQYAAVLLRRRIMKSRQWKLVPADVCQNIRGNILQLLLQEPEKPVRKAIAQVVGTVAKHDIPDQKWPEFFQFIELNTRSDNPQHREVGMFVLSSVSQVAGEQLQPHLVVIIDICGAVLDHQDSPATSLHAIQTLTSLVIMVGTEETKAFQAVIPKIMRTVQSLVAVDEEQACEAMEIFDELAECEVGIIQPHLKSTIEFCLEIGSNAGLDHPVRIKALSFVGWLVRLKRKTIIKLKLVQPILGILFPIMCEPQTEEEEEEEYEVAEASTASSFAAQVVDTMAQFLPPEKFMPVLMRLVEPALQSEDPNHRRAGLIALAVVAEGCADHIRSKHLKTMLQVVCKAVSDPAPQVSNAALFTLGQFSEFLQPDISKFSSELLPLIFEHLNKVSQNVDKEPKALTKAYYALEMFCENLEKDIVPYLPTLMQHLLTALTTATTARGKELAISAMAATANAAREEIVPYFGQIIEQLKGFLAYTEDENQLKVQLQALETLSILARTMGDHFLPIAAECLSLGLTLLAQASDPDLKRCLYGLLAAISTLIKADMAPHLPGIVKEMISSVKSSEGITAHMGDETTEMFRFFDEEGDAGEEQINGMNGEEEDEDEEEDEVKGYSISNAFLSEKEDACQALGELAINCGGAYMAYVEETFKVTLDIVAHPAENIRKAAVTTLSQLCIAVCKVSLQTNATDAHTAGAAMLGTVVPILLKTIREDADRHVAMDTMDALVEMLKEIKQPVLQAAGNDTVNIIMNTVRDVLQNKILCLFLDDDLMELEMLDMACQDDETEGDSELEDEQAEYDGMLIENAGELIPAVAKVIGGQLFAPYLAGLLPELLKKLKPTCKVSDKSFALGCLGETIHAMEGAATPFSPHLFPIFMAHLGDEDEEVRSNSVYGLGVLTANSGEAMYSNYPTIVRTLIDILSQESNGRVSDNICAALCRMIGANINGVPMEQVMPVILHCLPLKEDMEENETVYKCIAQLYQDNNQQVLSHVPQLLTILVQVVEKNQVEKEAKTLVAQLIQDLSQKYAEDFQKVSSSLTPEQVSKLQAFLGAVGS